MDNDVAIKICGLRDPTNIEDILALKPDYVGFIFYPKSKRYAVDHLVLAQLQHFDSNTKKVGVFVNQSLDEILEKQKEYFLDFVQLHGDESAQFCKELSSANSRVPIIKAFGVSEDFNFEQLVAYEPYCQYFLFDTKCDGYGGSGQTFSWDLLCRYTGTLPYFLSGGLGIENLSAAIAHVRQTPRAYGLDFNSRIEREAGIKAVQLVYQIMDSASK